MDWYLIYGKIITLIIQYEVIWRQLWGRVFDILVYKLIARCRLRSQTYLQHDLPATDFIFFFFFIIFQIEILLYRFEWLFLWLLRADIQSFPQ